MRELCFDFPRIFIAGLQGGAGKTTLTVGIIAAWRKYGKSIAAFKKGPDYIDAGWLALAAGRPCYNLDSFLLEKKAVLQSFLIHTLPNDTAVIEGNRGLYDGIDMEGRTSSAELAKLLAAPVVLCADCTKTTRTMAAVISGCIHFDPDLKIQGIILNRVAGTRHEQNLRRNIEHYCGIPVVGAVPKLEDHHFPERHMGLVPTPEHVLAGNAADAAAQIAQRHINLDALERIAQSAPAHVFTLKDREELSDSVQKKRFPAPDRPRIGIIRDSAFQFYYPDNIEALIKAGAETVFIRATEDRTVPDIDALYIGGGFPETHGEILAKNIGFRNEIRQLAEKGLPVYAECGGLMYLGDALVIDGKTYPMTGVLPAVFGISSKPQGLGYTIVTVDRENPWYPVGTEIRGHEFRYSRVLEWRGSDRDMVFRMKRGTGFANRRDGISYKNVFATYTHIHALGVPAWAETMVANATAFKSSKR